MASSSSSFSSKASSFSQKPRKRRWTREQLLHNLQIIGDLGAPLPPTLPPSPPASRAASPVVGFKRKLDPSSDLDPVKRLRTNLPIDRSQSQRHPPQSQPSPLPSLYQPQPQAPAQPPSIPVRQPIPVPPQSASSRSEPCEDGELREDVPVSAPAPRGNTVDVPIRRPKKGRPPPRHFDALHDKYHRAGRILKYSGDARFWSTYAPGHREYRPLSEPPPQNSPYHKHGGLIARLELLDALVCFTYSIWNKEYGRRTCSVETWSTIEAFLLWCKQKWHVEEGTSDAERAFLGLIWMIESFIQGRKMIYIVRGHLDVDVNKVHGTISKKISAAADTAMEGDPSLAASFGFPNGKPPPMLPSPSSTNSTPVNPNRDGSTPSSNSAQRPGPAAAHAASRQQQHYTGSVPFKLLPSYMQNTTAPIPPHVMTSMMNSAEPIGPVLVHDLKDLITTYASTASGIQNSQTTLNLPLLRRCFPNTWARMMYTTLLPTEEHEPDLEDEEGELYWPDNCISGEGIGWVCLLGKAMIKEFGKAYGYMGVDGAVPKPNKPSEEAQAKGHPPPQPSVQQSQRQVPPPATFSSQSSSQRNSVSSGAPR